MGDMECKVTLMAGVTAQLNQLLPNAFKKTYAYRSNSFSITHLPEPEELEW